MSLTTPQGHGPQGESPEVQRRQVRADARANVGKVLEAAVAVFAEEGVDAPARTIATRAGVGVGTFYRHFPKRSTLIAEVFRNEVDACAAAASTIAAACGSDHVKALTVWLHRYMDFIASKRGLASALHSGDPAYVDLHDYFDQHLGPALESLLAPAIDASEVRADVPSRTILHAVRSACVPDDDGSIEHVRPVTDLLIDGLRFGALEGQRPTT